MAHAAPPKREVPNLAEVGAVVDRVVPEQLAEGDIPGAAVTVVAGGETVFSKGYGVADVDSRRPIEAAHTGFYTASLAKLFTATAIVQLANAGKLDLHADVNDYLKDFSVPDTYPGRPVTAHHLLTYTSGFDNNVYGWSQWDYDTMPSLKEFTSAEIPDRIRPPGELAAYNNFDFVLAGRLVEVVSGKNYADYLTDHVFAPLGMESTTAAQPHPEQLESALATSYRPDGDSQAVTAGHESPATPAGADMITTSSDMARFMIAQLRRDPRSGPGVADLLHKEQFTPDTRIPGMGYAFEHRPQHGQTVLFKDGDLPGTHSSLALLPESDIGIYVVYNGDGKNQAAFWGGKELINTIVDRYFSASAPRDARMNAPEVLRGDVSVYAGEYEATTTSKTSFMQVSSLTAPVTVETTGDGQVSTSGLSEDPSVTTQKWTQVQPGLFTSEDGSETIAFGDSGELVSSQTPYAAYVELDWHQSPRLHLFVVSVAALLLIIAFFLIPIQALVRARRPQATPHPVGARSARVLAWMTSLCVVMFGAGFAMISADPNRMQQIPLTGDLTLSIALNTVSVMAGLTIAVVIAAAVAWGRGWWTTIGRVAYSGFAVAAIAFLWVAITYQLIGVPLTLTV